MGRYLHRQARRQRPNLLRFPEDSSNDTQSGQDPREKCCYGGGRFLHALKAMVTRMLFLAHSIICVWRVSERLPEPFWWLLTITFIALIIEALFVLLYNHGKEWKW